MSDKPETYNEGKIYVEFSGIPSISLVSIIIKKGANSIQRIAEATRRRFFTLDKDWKIKLDRVDYMPELNGTITVPKIVNGNVVVFDGASVPLPWLVSFLSIGILRPLGVMLTASIVHDFAFKFGYLLVAREEDIAPKKVKIERHNVDRLFRDIIGTVNQVSAIGWLAWFFVRLGWLFGVKYNGKYFSGKPPIWVIIISAVCSVFLGIYLIDNWQFQENNFEFLVTCLIMLYLIFYIATIRCQPRMG
jgi:hypothetical protein